MASAWIEKRRTSDGLRYRVRYRVGESPVGRFGGSFQDEHDAKVRRKWILGELAAMRVPDISKVGSASLRRRRRIAEVKELDQVYADARKLSQQISLLQPKVTRETRRFLNEAEGHAMKLSDVLFAAWRQNGA